MGRCRLDEDEKKSKAAKTPGKTGRKGRAKAGGSGEKKATAKKTAKGKPKTPEPDDKTKRKGAKKALRESSEKGGEGAVRRDCAIVGESHKGRRHAQREVGSFSDGGARSWKGR